MKKEKTKQCVCCKKTKERKEFNKNRRMIDGLFIYCRECQSEKAKNYRLKRILDYTEREKKWRLDNADKIYAYHSKYYSRPSIKKKMKKYHQKYKKANRSEINKYQRTYYLNNLERLRKKGLEYYYKNKEEISKQRKAKRNKNKQCE